MRRLKNRYRLDKKKIVASKKRLKLIGGFSRDVPESVPLAVVRCGGESMLIGG